MAATKTVSLGAAARRRAVHHRQEAADNIKTAKYLDQAASMLKSVRLTREESEYVNISAYLSWITVSTSRPGLAQKIANDLAILLDVTFTKSFDAWSAHHTYKAQNVTGPDGKHYSEIEIAGNPPESCKIECVVVGTRVVEDTRWKVTCE